jgi:hypothetical protein
MSCAQCVVIVPAFIFFSKRDLQISRASSVVTSAVEKSTEPIRKTAAYKVLSETLVDALDDSGSAKHAGFEEREARRLRRQKRLEKAGRIAGIGPKRIVADPEFVISPPCVCNAHTCVGLGRHLFFTKIRQSGRLGKE